MKIVIIGGGIGGLALAILLQRKGVEVVVCERNEGIQARGHAFLMHTDGLSILNELKAGENIYLKNERITDYILRRPDGVKIKHLQLNSWQCIKRINLISFLYSLLPVDKIIEGRNFSHFTWKDGNATAAVFTNGDIEYGDIFVGADGSNSPVREAIFGKVEYSPIEVKEIVGSAARRETTGNHSSIFNKVQSNKEGMAFGYIPTSATDFVWFLQYDPNIADLTNYSVEDIKHFCNSMARDFPGDIKNILDSADFNTSYIWQTRDFDLLPAFHKKNIVLIGDSAHLSLPFTSSGTTNALVDAKTLTGYLEENSDPAIAFESYYNKRAAEISFQINLGRDLKKQFLEPEHINPDDMPLPLFSKTVLSRSEHSSKLIDILYFTDPICSTCWIIQPLLRKLKLEYSNYITIEYRMGGLLPSWEEYNKGKIRNPSDAARHWEEVCITHETPIDGDVWHEDPLNSSFPPSIAFKAAQMQDTDKAILFLRRIKEMVFLEKKNIIKWEFLEKAALATGLDSARLLRDFEGRAKELFRNDLQMAQALGVTGFPTLFFSNGSDKKFTMNGIQPYEKFEKIIHELVPFAKKEPVNTSPESLFIEFPTMTLKEFSFLSNISREAAFKVLDKIYQDGVIDKYESKNGIIWKNKIFPGSSTE